SAAGGGYGAAIELVMAVEDTVAGNVTIKRPKRPCKKRPAVTDASGSSHPPKKLRGDHGTSSGAATERSAIPPLVMIEAVVTSHVVSASFILVPETKTKTASLVCHFIFHDSSSAGTMRLDVAGSSHLPGKELSMGFPSRSLNLYAPLPNAFVTSYGPSYLGPSFPPFARLASLLRKDWLPSQVSAGRNKNPLPQQDCKKQHLPGSYLPFRGQYRQTTTLHSILTSTAHGCPQSLSAKDLELKDFNVTLSSLKSQNNGLVDQVHALEATCFGLRD
nr:hypothetical protein [Tanacetum cinerariifolium]